MEAAAKQLRGWVARQGMQAGARRLGVWRGATRRAVREQEEHVQRRQAAQGKELEEQHHAKEREWAQEVEWERGARRVLEMAKGEEQGRAKEAMARLGQEHQGELQGLRNELGQAEAALGQAKAALGQAEAEAGVQAARLREMGLRGVLALLYQAREPCTLDQNYD